MKVHKVILFLLDIHDIGLDATLEAISNHRAICSVGCTVAETIEIKDWDDGHPMNRVDTDHEAWWKENK